MLSFISRTINTLLKPFGVHVVRGQRLQRTSNERASKQFSANCEEAILHALIRAVETPDKYYVDIGASDGLVMSNTARLAITGWHGVCFEYDPKRFAVLTDAYAELDRVRACRSKITPQNVCTFLKAFHVPQRFGVLNLDIDSYDYFVLEALLQDFRPTIIMAEINEKIPPPLEFTVLFDEDHAWDQSHFYGQSISQLAKLCSAHHYSIADLEYGNAFLVDAEKYRQTGLTPEVAYQRGYASRDDRKQRFPWNENMEPLLTMPPDEAYIFLKNHFVKYEGKYRLSKPSSAVSLESAG